MVYCIIAYVSPEWSRKFNFIKKNMTVGIFEINVNKITLLHKFRSYSVVGWLLRLNSDLFPPQLILKDIEIFIIQMCDFTCCFSWYEHWCLALEGEHKLGIFENGMQRTKIGMMKSDIICTVQLIVLGWAGQDMLIKWGKVNACKIFFIKHEGKGHLGRVCLNGWKVLKLIWRPKVDLYSSQCHFLRHKFHMDWPLMEPEFPQWKVDS